MTTVYDIGMISTNVARIWTSLCDLISGVIECPIKHD